MIGLPNGLFAFQEDCVNFLLDTTSRTATDDNNTIVVKAPTGAGKTIILIDYVDKYLNFVDSKACFIWLCPGKGELEEQSRDKMIRHLPNRTTKNLSDVLLTGFDHGDTVFINWELITKEGNKAISDGERKNLFERIGEAQRNGIRFILIIDEEHSHDTRKARDIIESFDPSYTIRVSATARKDDRYSYYEISEIDVINSGLITKALYINEGVESGLTIDDEHRYLIELANNKRRAIEEAYRSLSKDIRPLVLIQFPDMSSELIKHVEDILSSMGHTYETKRVAKWMSDSEDKINIDGIEENNAEPIFLLMKQAVATGWDCPRAKILVKLRENMNEVFTIQTIGRLRRMPEARHYDNDLLDYCFLYTFDEEYRQSIKQEISNAFDVKRVRLKEKCRAFTIEKQLRNLDVDELGERETCEVVHRYLVQKYGLGSDFRENAIRLEAAGYVMTPELVREIRAGRFVETESIFDESTGTQIEIRRTVNTHEHGIAFMHSLNAIKSNIGLKQSKLRTILERLFRNNAPRRHRLLGLNNREFYAFVINNEKELRSDFEEATSQMTAQSSLRLQPRTTEFRIPEEELIRYDASETDAVIMSRNAYEDYPSSVLAEGIRSRTERLFERYCETNDNVDWVYKNGDKGQQYFSIVYIDAFQKQWLFYPDYIVKLRNGDVWIIETKGGETTSGQSQDIDRQTINKFEAFKDYARGKDIKWGFVRERNEQLKFNNTVYTKSLQTEYWVPISRAF